ncbi:MAG TPA: TIGR02556 family CRISPR-associated protein [Clostridia bacterium]|nr:TIGR02556 family CRISPR-associated protein [Clostridia bacterium]
MSKGGDKAGDLLNDLIQPAPKVQKGEIPCLVKLNFHTSPGGPRLTPEYEEIDRKVLRRYVWVGNAVGNRPQRYLTTNVLDYLMGPAPSNLVAALEASEFANSALCRRLKTFVAEYYYTLPDGTRVLDPQRIGLGKDDPLSAIRGGVGGKTPNKEAKKGHEKAKEAIASVTKLVKKWVLDELELKPSRAVLWTILLDGEPLAADHDYETMVLRWKEGVVSKGDTKSARGVCAICGATDRSVTYNFAQLDFLKYYITDKIGAASGVSEEGFSHNFLACADCFRGLVVAEKYISQHLSLNVGPLDFLVLPAFLREPVLSREDLMAWAEKLRARVGALASVSSWLDSLAGKKGLEEELADFLEELPYENVALLNFLFYRKSKSEFRILGLAKDVTPGRISHLLKTSHRLANRAEALLGSDRWWLDLTRIYQLIPLNEGARHTEFKRLVHIYTCLLAGEALEYPFLIRQFVELAQIYHTENFAGTNVRPPQAGYEEAEMARRLLQANLFLKLLRDENLLRGGRSLGIPSTSETELLPEDMRAYLAEMAYDGPQTALFLLGYLLNQVGRAQVNAGYTNKPVLDKVNYNGMLWPKVVRLSNLLVDQLRQHDLFRYHEGLFAVMKRLFDAYRREWLLSPEENVFYILSGYSYGVRMALKAWADKQVDNE